MDLQAPTRNRYLSGELLDADDFTNEQAYHTGHRRLLNRLTLGPGVLCGLHVEGTSDGKVVVERGVAIDAFGREIVVPTVAVVDNPGLVTDDSGQPTGRSMDQGRVTLYLCYAESDPDSHVGATGAGSEDGAPRERIVEGYRIAMRDGWPSTEIGFSRPQCDAIFRAHKPENVDGRVTTCESLDRSCVPSDKSCVVIATLTLFKGSGRVEVNECSHRTEVYSNSQLLDLILGLTARVTAMEKPRHQFFQQLRRKVRGT